MTNWLDFYHNIIKKVLQSAAPLKWHTIMAGSKAYVLSIINISVNNIFIGQKNKLKWLLIDESKQRHLQKAMQMIIVNVQKQSFSPVK